MDDRELLNTVIHQIGDEHCSDDCAVMPGSEGWMVVSTDMLHEKTDFPAGITDWQIGWMSVAVTISDIASMGAEPKWIFLAIGLNNENQLSGIVKGARDCADKFGATYAGGDLDAHSELTIVSTGIGVVKEGAPVRRDGACSGDLVCVTGTLGRAIRGLRGNEKYWRDLCQPSPRVMEGIEIRKAGATAMMDISDGLALSLHDLGKASSVRIDIQKKQVPAINDEKQAKEDAIFEGGDFELLFTISPEKMNELKIPYTCVGRVSEGRGVYMDGISLPNRGYAHHW